MFAYWDQDMYPENLEELRRRGFSVESGTHRKYIIKWDKIDDDVYKDYPYLNGQEFNNKESMVILDSPRSTIFDDEEET